MPTNVNHIPALRRHLADKVRFKTESTMASGNSRRIFHLPNRTTSRLCTESDCRLHQSFDECSFRVSDRPAFQSFTTKIIPNDYRDVDCSPFENLVENGFVPEQRLNCRLDNLMRTFDSPFFDSVVLMGSQGHQLINNGARGASLTDT